MPGKSILLLLCTFFVLSIGLSTTGYAEKPDNGKGKPDKSGTTCERNFCIRFEDDHEVTRDDVVEPGEPGEPEEYCHRTDKVLAFTGKGPGFHFDTTQSGKGKTMTRSLDIDLTVFDVDGFADGDPGLIRVDLRFDRSVNGGLDLCSLKLDESNRSL